MAIGDLDGINGRDLAVANGGVFPSFEGDVLVLLNQGDGTFAAAVANGLSDDVSVLLNQGDGTFAAAVAYDAGGPAAGASG